MADKFFSSVSETGAKPVHLAFVTMLSGQGAGAFGIAARNTAELLVEMINQGDNLPAPYAGKGFGTRSLTASYYDETLAAKDPQGLFKHIAEQGADAVIGYVGSNSALAVAPLAEDLKQLTLIFNAGTSQLYAERNWQWTFRTQPTTGRDAIGAARYVQNNFPSASRFAGINPDDAWGVDSWNEFQAAYSKLSAMKGHKSAECGGHFFPLLSAAIEQPLANVLSADIDILHSSNWGGDLFSLIRNLDGKTKPRLVLISGESALRRMADYIPEGSVIGGRGASGLLARDTDLNRWFVQTYQSRYDVAPIYPAYGMANSILGLKAAWDKCGAEAGAQIVVDAFAGSTYRGLSSDIHMSRANGRQGASETGYGQVRRDAQTGKIELVDIQYFPAEEVNAPEGTGVLDWINSGFA